MSKKAKKTTSKKTQAETAQSNGDVEFTAEQRKVIDQLQVSASALANSLASVFESDKLTPKQKRFVKRQVVDVVQAPFTTWRKAYNEDVESRREEREQARLDRIAQRRAKLAEQKKRLAEREAKLAEQEKELSR